MSTALTTVATAAPSTALEPTTIDQAFWLAQQLLKSGLLGKAIQKPEAAFAVILAGRELGLTAMQSLRSLHLIEGKPTLSADLMVALVKRSPLCKSFKLVESTGERATYEANREGEGVTRMSFTIEEAKAAGVTGKDNWKKYPAAMLRARCIAALARVVFPDLLLGVYENDELAPASNNMPSVSVQATATVLPLSVVAEPEPIAPPAAEAAGDAVALWSQRLLDAEADGLEAVEGVRAQCKAEVTDSMELNSIGMTYTQIKKRLNPQFAAATGPK